MPGHGPAPRRTLLAAIILIVAACVAYLPVIIWGGFIWDDESYVTDRQRIEQFQNLDGLRQFWLEPASIPQYYPMVFTTFWIEYHLWGLHPRGYHAVNVILHAINALLLWRVLRQLIGSHCGVAWLAAAIFALHPVHVESVAWITERKNVLSALFYLLAALAYLRSPPSPLGRGARGDGAPANDRANVSPSALTPSLSQGERGWAWYIASLGLFILALLSKSVTCSLPAAMLLVIWWKRGTIRWHDVLPLLPMFALGAAAGWWTAHLEEVHVGARDEVYDLSWIERCLIAGRALWFYAAKLVWPVNLAFIYERWTIDAGDWRQYFYPLAALAAPITLWLLRKRLGRGPLVAVLFFAGTLVPALGFINVFPMRYAFVADHFQYLASIGLIALTATMICDLRLTIDQWWNADAYSRRHSSIVNRQSSIPGFLLPTFVLLILAVLTARQCLVYENLETLWRDTIAKNPDGWLPHNNLGVLLADRGDLDEAARMYERAIENDLSYGDTFFNLAAIRVTQGRAAEAMRLYEQGLQRHPDRVPPRYNLARLLVDQGRPAEAEQQYRKVIELDPGLPEARINLAMLLQQRGQREEALELYRAAAAQARQVTPEARQQCADGFFVLGDFAAAAEQFAMLVNEQPNNAYAHRLLGMSLANLRRYEDAIAPLQRAVDLEPTDAATVSALSRVREIVGRQ